MNKLMTAWVAVMSISMGSSAIAATAKLSISTEGSNLAFNKKTLKVKAGQTVKLTFDNKAAKDSGLQHNWILTKQGTDQDVANAGIQAGPGKGYIPDSPNILAHTKLLNPGEKETIEFKAPDQTGDYPYICSFPGHSMMMKGTLTVTK